MPSLSLDGQSLSSIHDPDNNNNNNMRDDLSSLVNFKGNKKRTLYLLAYANKLKIITSKKLH